MNILRNKDIIKHTPILTTGLLESANLFQLYEMWSTNTSAGQSPWGWICVNLALLLWLNWYYTFTPEQKTAIYATIVGLFINASVILSTFILK